MPNDKSVLVFMIGIGEQLEAWFVGDFTRAENQIEGALSQYFKVKPSLELPVVALPTIPRQTMGQHVQGTSERAFTEFFQIHWSCYFRLARIKWRVTSMM